MNQLKEMYKSLPKSLILVKHNLVFYISGEMYFQHQKYIHNNRFMGINIIVDKRIARENGYLTTL